MKIAISCHPTHGGSGVVATELAHALAERGHEIHVVSYERPFRLRDHTNLYFHRINVTEYPLFRYPPYEMTLANRLAEIAVDRQLDLIHAHYAVPHAVSAMLARDMLCVCEHSVKVVTTLHGTDITLVGSQRDFLRVCRYAMMKGDGLTAVSNWLRDETMRTFDLPDAPTVIPNFVDCERFHPNGRSAFDPAQPAVLLHASNFRPVKRVYDVVRVFQQVRQRMDARLLMVGDGPERGAAMELAAELNLNDDIEWVGNTNEIEEVYRRAHLYLLLSEHESFGLSALEAMAAGTPVLGSRAGGLIEVVREGADGHLRPVGHVEEMATAALGIFESAATWQRYSRSARDSAHSRYCRELVIPEYEKFYQQVLGTP